MPGVSREWTFVIAFVSLQFFYALLYGVLDFVPKLGKWFRLAPGPLEHVDSALPLESLAGFLIAYGGPLVLGGVLYLVLVSRFIRVPENSIGTRIIYWMGAYSVILQAQDWIFRRLRLPDPHDSDFAVIWSKVAAVATAIHLGPWFGPLMAIASFLSLATLALLAHMIWKSSADAEDQEYSGSHFYRRARLTIGMTVSFIATVAWRFFGPRVMAKSTFQGAGSAITPSSFWIAWSAGMLLVVYVLVWSTRYFGRGLLHPTRPNGSRFTMVAAGILWSLLAAGGAAAAAAQSHQWSTALAHALPSPVLLRYASILGAQSVAASLLLHGHILPTATVLYNRNAAFVLCSFGYTILFAYPGLSLGEFAFLGLFGFFLSLLFWFTQAVWAPIAFQVGWWLLLGPLLGFVVPPLRAPLTGNPLVPSVWLNSRGPHVDGLSAMTIAIGFSIFAAYLLQPRLRTAPIGGSD